MMSDLAPVSSRSLGLTRQACRSISVRFDDDRRTGLSFLRLLEKEETGRFRALLEGALIGIPGMWDLSMFLRTGRKGRDCCRTHSQLVAKGSAVLVVCPTLEVWVVHGAAHEYIYIYIYVVCMYV